MPLYEYVCPKCGFYGSIVRSIHEDTPSTWECPECAADMYRYYGSVNFILKGEGWPGKEIKQENEDNKAIIKGQIARRLKASGAVPMEEKLMEKDVHIDRFHGDMKFSDLTEGKCDYDGLKGKKKQEGK